MGLDGRGTRFVLEAKAEPMEDGCGCARRELYDSSRLVAGRKGYGALISPRLSGAVLFSSLLRWCRCPGNFEVILCARCPDLVDVCSEDLLRPFSTEDGSWIGQ